MSEKMTIHGGLVELKLIDKKLVASLQRNKKFIGVKDSDGKIDKHILEADLLKSIQSNTDTVESLIKRKIAIKNAIIMSNAVTKIKIGEEEYTVAEAIAMRDLIEGKRTYLRVLKEQYNKAVGDVKTINEKVKREAEDRAVATFGNGDNSKVDKTAAGYKSMVDQIVKDNSVELVDPLKLEKKIEDLEIEIEEFDANIDALLSTSNALTTIEF